MTELGNSSVLFATGTEELLKMLNRKRAKVRLSVMTGSGALS